MELVLLMLGVGFLFSRSRRRRALASGGGLTPPPMYRNELAPGSYEVGPEDEIVLSLPGIASDVSVSGSGLMGDLVPESGEFPDHIFHLSNFEGQVGGSMQLSFLNPEGGQIGLYNFRMRGYGPGEIPSGMDRE